MTEDITEAVNTCEACQKFSRSQPVEKILPFPPPAVVGSDLVCTRAGDSFMVGEGPCGPDLLPAPAVAGSNDQQHPSTSILENTQLDHCYHSVQPLSK